MQIASVTFSNPEQSRVSIVDGENILSAPWPIQSWHREPVAAWLATGNAIGAYDASMSGPKLYSKARLFDAMNDGEFATWQSAEASFPARQRAIFNHASEVSSDHHLFPTLRDAMLAAYGLSRTNALLSVAEI